MIERLLSFGFDFVCLRLMIKWNCCKIHGPICLYWITYIIDCTTICPTRHRCITAKSLICSVWDCLAYHNWPIDSMKSKINCKSWSSMLAITFAWSFCCCWIQVQVNFVFFRFFTSSSSIVYYLISSLLFWSLETVFSISWDFSIESDHINNKTSESHPIEPKQSSQPDSFGIEVYKCYVLIEFDCSLIAVIMMGLLLVHFHHFEVARWLWWFWWVEKCLANFIKCIHSFLFHGNPFDAMSCCCHAPPFRVISICLPCECSRSARYH